MLGNTYRLNLILNLKSEKNEFLINIKKCVVDKIKRMLR